MHKNRTRERKMTENRARTGAMPKKRKNENRARTKAVPKKRKKTGAPIASVLSQLYCYDLFSLLSIICSI